MQFNRLEDTDRKLSMLLRWGPWLTALSDPLLLLLNPTEDVEELFGREY